MNIVTMEAADVTTMISPVRSASQFIALAIGNEETAVGVPKAIKTDATA